MIDVGPSAPPIIPMLVFSSSSPEAPALSKTLTRVTIACSVVYVSFGANLLLPTPFIKPKLLIV